MFRKVPSAAADAVLQATTISLHMENAILNIGPQDNINILDLANEVMSELDIIKPIKWLGEEAGWIGDDKYVSIKSSVPCRSSQKAIVDYVKEYKKNSNNRR